MRLTHENCSVTSLSRPSKRPSVATSAPAMNNAPTTMAEFSSQCRNTSETPGSECVTDPCVSHQKNPVIRTAFLLLGIIAVALGTVGIVVPGLPTTPFLLLACWCFSRSSRRMEKMLIRSRLLGPVLQDWKSHRALQPNVKRGAIFMVSLMLTLICLMPKLTAGLRAVILTAGAIGIAVIVRLPIIRNQD
ncbi:MAG: YbaN family protein [Planctomycetaceae bacterium]|nr:YbaN family protein [Planctomycetaceae bacterium]